MNELSYKDKSWTEDKLERNAQKALTLLLHDYSRFRIETIDSFFQTILRNLAKELGLGAYVNIELNTELLIKDAVNITLEKIKKD